MTCALYHSFISLVYLLPFAASKIMSGCGSSLAMQELIGKYIVLENYFMSESLSKVRVVETRLWSDH